MDANMLLQTIFYFYFLLLGVVCGTNRIFPFKVCKHSRSSDPVLEVQEAPSIISCAARCLDHPLCSSVNFYKSTKVCELSEKMVSGCSELTTDLSSKYAQIVDPCLNGATYDNSSKTCQCAVGYTGTNCYRRYRDCQEVPNPLSNLKVTIQPLTTNLELKLYCDNSGTTILFNIYKFGPNEMNKNWNDFKTGFYNGNFRGQWGGNEDLYQLLQHGVYDLRIYINSLPTVQTWLVYSNFRLEPESGDYRMTYDSFSECAVGSPTNCNSVADGLSGNGDTNLDMNGTRFGTFDRDQYGCAATEQMGWWYNTQCSLVVPQYKTPPFTITWPLKAGGTVDLFGLQARLVPVYFYQND